MQSPASSESGVQRGHPGHVKHHPYKNLQTAAKTADAAPGGFDNQPLQRPVPVIGQSAHPRSVSSDFIDPSPPLEAFSQRVPETRGNDQAHVSTSHLIGQQPPYVGAQTGPSNLGSNMAHSVQLEAESPCWSETPSLGDNDPTRRRICQYGSCGQAIPPGAKRPWYEDHFKEQHPELKSCTTVKCLWPGCKGYEELKVANIPKHVAYCHMKVDEQTCESCGKVISRRCALRRHQLSSCKGPAFGTNTNTNRRTTSNV